MEVCLEELCGFSGDGGSGLCGCGIVCGLVGGFFFGLLLGKGGGRGERERGTKNTSPQKGKKDTTNTSRLLEDRG